MSVAIDCTVIGEPDLKLGGGYAWIPLNRTAGASAQVVRINIATNAVTVIDLTDGDIGCYAGCWNPDNNCFYTVDTVNGRPYKITAAGAVTRGDAIANGNASKSGLELAYAAGKIWTVGAGWLHELDPDTLAVDWQATHGNYQRQILFANGFIWSGAWNVVRRVTPVTHAVADYNLNITTGGGEVFCGAVGRGLLWFSGPDGVDAPKLNHVNPLNAAVPVTPDELDIRSYHAGLTDVQWPHCMVSDDTYLFIGFWKQWNDIACLHIPSNTVTDLIAAGDSPTAAGKVHGIDVDVANDTLWWAKADVAQECYAYKLAGLSGVLHPPASSSGLPSRMPFLGSRRRFFG